MSRGGVIDTQSTWIRHPNENARAAFCNFSTLRPDFKKVSLHLDDRPKRWKRMAPLCPECSVRTSTKLDCCKSVYSGLKHKDNSRLWHVTNSVARHLTGSRQYEDITPILAPLHWLSTQYRIDFKLLLITF